jgi:hypothetical protein
MEEMNMPNWTPMELSVDGEISEALAGKLAEALEREHGLLPDECRSKEDIADRLRRSGLLEWESAGASTFSPTAIRLFKEVGLKFTYSERDGYLGEGIEFTYDPATGETTEEYLENENEDLDA